MLLLLFPFMRWVKGQMSLMILIGLCLGACHYSLMFYALYVGENVSSIAVAAQLSIPFSTILAVVFLKESVGWTRVLAIVAAFSGIVIIGFEPFGRDHIPALFLAALASLALAIATILMRRLQNVGVFNLQAWIALVSTIVLALLTWAFEKPDSTSLMSIPVLDYWTPVYSAIGATIFGHGSLYYLLQRYPVNHVAPFISLATLFGIAFAILFVNDEMTIRVALGGFLTVLGVTVVALRNASNSTPSGLRTPR